MEKGVAFLGIKTHLLLVVFLKCNILSSYTLTNFFLYGMTHIIYIFNK